MADTQWYYARNKQKIGPVSMAQLRRLVAGGQLRANDMLLQAGATKWVEAQSVPGLVQPPARPSTPISAPAPAASGGTSALKTATRVGKTLLAEAGLSILEALKQTARFLAYGWGFVRGRLLARKAADVRLAQEHARRQAQQRRTLFPANGTGRRRVGIGYCVLALALGLGIMVLGRGSRPEPGPAPAGAPGDDGKLASAQQRPAPPVGSPVQGEETDTKETGTKETATKETATKELMRIVAPYVNETTQVVAHANVPKLDLKKYFQTVTAFAGERREVADIREFAVDQHDKLLKAGVHDVLAVVNLSDFSGRNPPEVVLVAPFRKGADVSDLLKLIGEIPGFTGKTENDSLIARFGPATERAPKDRPEFSAGLEALRDKHIQLIAAPSADLRKFAERPLQALPPVLGRIDVTLLTKGIRWAGVGYDTSMLTQEYVVDAKDAQTAKDLKALADKGLDLLEKIPDLPGFAEMRALLDFKQQGERLSLTVSERALNTMLQSMVTKVRGAAEQTQSMNNLKQIGLSMHNYQDFNKSLPARANFTQEGKPLLSWRVHILPLIEEIELYQQFKLDEPWDSPHNKKLIARMPKLYASPLSKVKDGKTTYLALTGKGSMFDGNKGIRLTDVTDGTSNTLMVVEANDTKAVIWTQPDDFPIDTKDPLAALARPELKGFLALFADGSVRVAPATIPLATLRALFTRNGGEKVEIGF